MGPRTNKGKTVSGMNALKLGLVALHNIAKRLRNQEPIRLKHYDY